ncbi:MAG TPA: MoxR family ATPase [Chloroflexota bacterium]|nr:MoxR family ATPase [Chloroflexota bacterium]
MSLPATAEALTRFADNGQRLLDTIGSVVLGQDEVVRQVVLTLLAGGHVLLEGVPGVGKTLLVRTLAASLDADYARIQFTPDLMPADITGTMMLRDDEGGRSFVFQPGPLFGNVILADEINRATPKTQSALLEAMQEQTVTVGDRTRLLPQPFFVLATQNPLEMEGTYPLPEAQLDRFLLKVVVPFPSPESLRAIGLQTVGPEPQVVPVLDRDTILEMIDAARTVPIAGPVMDHAIALLLATRPESSRIDLIRKYVHAGAGPRGLQAMLRASQVRALLDGRYHVSTEDVRALAVPALRHRLLLTFEAQADGIVPETLLEYVLDATAP